MSEEDQGRNANAGHVEVKPKYFGLRRIDLIPLIEGTRGKANLMIKPTEKVYPVCGSKLPKPMKR